MRVNKKGRFEETYAEAMERMREGKVRRDALIDRVYNEAWRIRELFGRLNKETIRHHAPGPDCRDYRFRAMLLSLLTNGSVDDEPID
jgi:hypothetical protein